MLCFVILKILDIINVFYILLVFLIVNKIFLGLGDVKIFFILLFYIFFKVVVDSD